MNYKHIFLSVFAMASCGAHAECPSKTDALKAVQDATDFKEDFKTKKAVFSSGDYEYSVQFPDEPKFEKLKNDKNATISLAIENVNREGTIKDVQQETPMGTCSYTITPSDASMGKSKKVQVTARKKSKWG